MDYIEKILQQMQIKNNGDIVFADDGTIEGLILSGEYDDIGYTVLKLGKIDKKTAFNAVTACRRKFKAEDILLFSVMDPAENGESGIVFTKEKLFFFWDNEVREIVDYEDIDDVDFDENSVTIKTVTGAEKEIYCGDNGIDYDKYMYHMLMDIHDRLQE